MARLVRALAASALAVTAFAAAQSFRENVRIGLVSIRLDVKGRDGHPVADLQASDVKLKVDGKEVAVEGLDRVSAAASPAAARAEGAGTAQSAAATTGATADPAAAALGSSSDLYLAVLFDATSSNAYDRRDMLRQLESFLKERPATGVHVMVEHFDGRLHTDGPWTMDPATAVAALKKMQKSLADAHVPSPSELSDEIRNGRIPRDIEMQVDLSGRRTTDGILQALIRFPEVPGRKGLVFITDGTPLVTPFDLSILMGKSDTTSQQDAATRAEYLRNHDETAAAQQIETALQDQALATFTESASNQSAWAQRMAKITNKAVELDIAFYPIDSEAVDRGTNPGADSKWPGRSMPGVAGVGQSTSSGMTARVAVAQTMTALADKTGGQPLLAPLQAADRLGTIASDRTSGYVLTFRDPSPNDNRYHNVEIVVNRPGAKVAYRHGFRVRSDDERTLDAVVAHLQESVTDNPLNLKAAFDVVRKEGGRDIVQMSLEFSPAEAPGDAAPERVAQIWAVCSDDDGNRAKPIIRNVKAQRVPNAKVPSYGDSMQLGLPPGPYTWSVAVRDAATGVTSYAVVHKQL